MLRLKCKLCFIIILIKCILANSSSNYTTDALAQQYPDYGTKWIYFPDGDGIPRVGYLELPQNDFLPHSSGTDEVEKALKFRLYTRKLKDGRLVGSQDVLLKSEFDVNKETKFITHGWLSSGASDTCIYIKDAYLFKEDVNVIIADWSEIAGNIFYPIPMGQTPKIGHHYAQFLNHLIKNGANPSKIHLIGHSLGAHVSGFAGRGVTTGKLNRITGLDPALPGFNNELQIDRLLPSDADFVDVVHTCGGVLGVLQNLGHADFYPNGGTPPQPGCGGLAQIVEACSHGRSWKYFAESIIKEHSFMSQRCQTWAHYLSKSCENDLIPMGNSAPFSARGSYFASTESSPPFAKINTLYHIDDNRLIT